MGVEEKQAVKECKIPGIG